MVLARKLVVHAREVESTHSHAEDAMGRGKAGPRCTVLVAKELDDIHWVIAELVKGLVALHAWSVTCTLKLEVQGLFVIAAPPRLRIH
jgi:hypothetical protein